MFATSLARSPEVKSRHSFFPVNRLKFFDLVGPFSPSGGGLFSPGSVVRVFGPWTFSPPLLPNLFSRSPPFARMEAPEIL